MTAIIVGQLLTGLLLTCWLVVLLVVGRAAWQAHQRAMRRVRAASTRAASAAPQRPAQRPWWVPVQHTPGEGQSWR